jgi:hypothetical protein
LLPTFQVRTAPGPLVNSLYGFRRIPDCCPKPYFDAVASLQFLVSWPSDFSFLPVLSRRTFPVRNSLSDVAFANYRFLTPVSIPDETLSSLIQQVEELVCIGLAT